MHERRTRSRCCASAATGHATAALLNSLMNSRRLMLDMLSPPNHGQPAERLPPSSAFCAAAKAPLFDHLVSLNKQRGRQLEAERLGSLDNYLLSLRPSC